MRYTEVLQHGEEIKKLRSDGMKWKDIARIYDCPYQYVQQAVEDPKERKERIRQCVRKSYYYRREQNVEFSKAFRIELIKHDLRLKDVADRCGVCTQTVSNWKNGVTRPKEKYLKILFGENFKIERADETDLSLP